MASRIYIYSWEVASVSVSLCCYQLYAGKLYVVIRLLRDEKENGGKKIDQ